MERKGKGGRNRETLFKMDGSAGMSVSSCRLHKYKFARIFGTNGRGEGLVGFRDGAGRDGRLCSDAKANDKANGRAHAQTDGDAKTYGCAYAEANYRAYGKTHGNANSDAVPYAKTAGDHRRHRYRQWTFRVCDGV